MASAAGAVAGGAFRPEAPVVLPGRELVVREMFRAVLAWGLPLPGPPTAAPRCPQ